MISIITVDAKDMTSKYGSELLAFLEDCQDVRFGNVINFSTNTKFETQYFNPTIEAFNVYLRMLKKHASRIIINL